GVPGAHLKWGWAWPANRRNIYNRASADLNGNPWSERKRWVWWDPTFVNPPDPKTGKKVPNGKWVGYDVPDFTLTMATDHKGKWPHPPHLPDHHHAAQPRAGQSPRDRSHRRAQGRGQDDSPRRYAVALGLDGVEHGRRRERPHVLGGRSQRVHPRRQGVRLQ